MARRLRREAKMAEAHDASVRLRKSLQACAVFVRMLRRERTQARQAIAHDRLRLLQASWSAWNSSRVLLAVCLFCPNRMHSFHQAVRHREIVALVVWRDAVVSRAFQHWMRMAQGYRLATMYSRSRAQQDTRQTMITALRTWVDVSREAKRARVLGSKAEAWHHQRTQKRFIGLWQRRVQQKACVARMKPLSLQRWRNRLLLRYLARFGDRCVPFDTHIGSWRDYWTMKTAGRALLRLADQQRERGLAGRAFLHMKRVLRARLHRRAQERQAVAVHHIFLRSTAWAGMKCVIDVLRVTQIAWMVRLNATEEAQLQGRTALARSFNVRRMLKRMMGSWQRYLLVMRQQHAKERRADRCYVQHNLPRLWKHFVCTCLIQPCLMRPGLECGLAAAVASISCPGRPLLCKAHEVSVLWSVAAVLCCMCPFS
jgi:hypothetical protein